MKVLVKKELKIKGTGLGGEELSENKQLLEGITERFKVNVDPKQILKKDSLYRKRKKESSRNKKKGTSWKNFVDIS